jgi:hypothetical protein
VVARWLPEQAGVSAVGWNRRNCLMNGAGDPD